MSRQLGPSTGAVARAKRLLAETADREVRLSLHEVADAVSRSPFHLARSFRQQTGLSLHQYRQHLRLAAAMERLVEGDADLAGIAHDLGYCSQSHLGAVFRREVGVTLGEARRTLAARI
jgi:AraC-like DNA-binding protein